MSWTFFNHNIDVTGFQYPPCLPYACDAYATLIDTRRTDDLHILFEEDHNPSGVYAALNMPDAYPRTTYDDGDKTWDTWVDPDNCSALLLGKYVDANATFSPPAQRLDAGEDPSYSATAAPNAYYDSQFYDILCGADGSRTGGIIGTSHIVVATPPTGLGNERFFDIQRYYIADKDDIYVDAPRVDGVKFALGARAGTPGKFLVQATAYQGSLGWVVGTQELDTETPYLISMVQRITFPTSIGSNDSGDVVWTADVYVNGDFYLTATHTDTINTAGDTILINNFRIWHPGPSYDSYDTVFNPAIGGRGFVDNREKAEQIGFDLITNNNAYYFSIHQTAGYTVNLYSIAFNRNKSTYEPPNWCATTPLNPPPCEPYACDAFVSWARTFGDGITFDELEGASVVPASFDGATYTYPINSNLIGQGLASSGSQRVQYRSNDYTLDKCSGIRHLFLYENTFVQDPFTFTSTSNPLQDAFNVVVVFAGELGGNSGVGTLVQFTGGTLDWTGGSETETLAMWIQRQPSNLFRFIVGGGNTAATLDASDVADWDKVYLLFARAKYVSFGANIEELTVDYEYEATLRSLDGTYAKSVSGTFTHFTGLNNGNEDIVHTPGNNKIFFDGVDGQFLAMAEAEQADTLISVDDAVLAVNRNYNTYTPPEYCDI